MSALSNKQDEIRRAIQSSRAPSVVRAVVDRRLTYLSVAPPAEPAARLP